MKTYRYFYLFCIALGILLFVPNLLQKGMFVDGVWYATISKNLAHGIGSFWQPVFTRTMFAEFYEHPPLVFGLQSLFFSLLGDGVYVEKLYAFVIILLTVFLIHRLWKQVFIDQPRYQNYSFIPIILWMVHDTTYLYYSNNLLECTQGVFVLLAVILILIAVRKETWHSLLYLIGAGILLFGAFLSKGFIGLYPLVAIPLYAFTHQGMKAKKTILYTGFLIAGFTLNALLLYAFNEAARENFLNYLDTQVLAALKGNRQENMQAHRYNILIKLFESSLLPLVITLVFSLIAYFRYGIRQLFQYKAQILFFTFLMLSGVLPMMVSKKQASYYLITVTPYLSIALAYILLQSQPLLDRIEKTRFFHRAVLVLAAAAIIYPIYKIHSYNKRDRVVLQDMEQFEAHLTENSTIGCATNSWEISMYGYFMRYYGVSLDTAMPYSHNLLVRDRELPYDSVNYIPVDLSVQRYELCIKQAGGL